MAILVNLEKHIFTDGSQHDCVIISYWIYHYGCTKHANVQFKFHK
jgi:hypothetical protein